LLHSNRSASHCMLGKYADAKEDAEIAIRIRPSWGKGFYRKGEALLGLRDYEEAIRCYEECLERDPTSPDARVGIANAAIKLEDARSGLFIRQILVGRDIASGRSLSPIQSRINEAATSMRNFIYLIGDRDTKKCVLIDACWDVNGLLKIVKQEGYELVGLIVTHHHFDHVGGVPPPPYDQFRIRVPGLASLMKKFPALTGYVHPEDIPRLKPDNPTLPLNRIIPTSDNFVLRLGERTILRFLHTPGHTPGSQCVLLNERRLISGDTLFLGCCGRLDLPGADRDSMWSSLQRLSEELDAETIIYPGHEYGGEWSTVGEERLAGALRP
ncbi:beta-lactamase-like protein, partial [Piptocephalis cylindrospora]